jgi:hypothetical protein
MLINMFIVQATSNSARVITYAARVVSYDHKHVYSPSPSSPAYCNEPHNRNALIEVQPVSSANISRPWCRSSQLAEAGGATRPQNLQSLQV